MTSRTQHRVTVLAGLTVLCVLAMTGSMMMGAEKVSFSDLLTALGLANSGSATHVDILRTLRFPRILLAALVGGALAVSGASLQALFRNPMADPYLLGISAGGAFGAVIAMTFEKSIQLGPFSLVPLFAGVGAVGTVWIVYAIGRTGGRVQPTTLLLTGVAVSTLLMALMSFVVIRGASDQTAFFVRMYAWMLGGFDRTAGMKEPLLAAPYFAIGVLIIFGLSHSLNVMLMGEESAHSMGVDIERTKRIVLIFSSLLGAAAVCVAGIIGFVGLIAPHAVRLVIGPDHRWLLPGSLLAGATFLVMCDALARSVMPPTEFPVGIFSALLGVPFFLYLLKRSKRVYL